MADSNPFDALDEAPSTPPAASSAASLQNPFDALDETGPNPLYERNRAYAKDSPSGYQTKLPASQEQQFQQWVKDNHVPNDDSPTADYDMRGFWQGLKSGDPHAQSSLNANDHQLHFSDYWKTPYHKSFSSESRWATADAPKWNDKDQLVTPDGKVVYDERAGNNPMDALDEAPASAQTAATMQDVTDQAQMPEVTVRAHKEPEAPWSDVARGIPTAIGAGIETKLAGAQEYIGQAKYESARKQFWQAQVLPQAVRDAKKQGLALTDMPEVQSAAEHLGIRPDTFARDWPTYVNQSQDELEQLKARQRERIQTGSMQAETGSKRRMTAQRVQELYAPNMNDHSLKSLVFDAATMAPDLLAGVGATVATGGVGGAAVMAADIAPSEYAAARNRGLDHKAASTYAVLSTLASSVPEVPVLKIVENTPLANKIIGGIVGQKLASTGVGKVAGTAAAQGVTQSVVNALQQGIDAGVLNEHLPLKEALKQVAWSGLVGGVVGAPIGAFHAATSRPPKPTTFREIPEVGGGNGVEPSLQAPSLAPATPGGPEIDTSAGGSGQESLAPTLQDAAASEKGSAPPKNISPEHAALLAMKNKTVTPPQVELLERAGLVKRNDLNEPLLLPAGRRRLTALDAQTEAPVSAPVVQPEPPKPLPESTGSAPAQGPRPELETTAAPESPAEPVGSEPQVPEPQAEAPGSTESAAEESRPEMAASGNNRLASDADLRAGLLGMKGETGWAQVGGRVLRDASTDQVTGRTTWIPNADWWPGRPKGLKEAEVHAAVDKALAGQPLRKREQAMVDYMTAVHDERVAMGKTHEELAAAVPDLRKQPEGALDLTLLASRAAEFDANEAARIMDTWEDDKPETIARVRGEFEQIIGRGHNSQKESLELTAQEGGAGEPAAAARTSAALDLFGEDRTREQALADETRRRDALRSPNRDVSAETGLPGDLFSQSRRQVDFTDQLKQARAETHTTPTEGQKGAGNYRKGRINFGGMEVAIENPKGSTRSGVGTDGKPWSRELKHDYGYFVGTKGADGDAVDAFLTGKPDTGKIFAINQVDPETGKFDEVKVIAGAESAQEAQEVYHANYPRGWKGLGSMAELPTGTFRQWLDSGNTHKPVPGAERLERREPGGARRAKVSEMTPEELRKELLTHELTGIPNRRAYTEAKKLPHQVAIDVDSLKWVNDNMGHESGDELLKAIATSLSSHSDNVFHLSGDEFAAQAHTETEAHELLNNVADHLKNASIEVEMPDGRVVKLKGMGVSYGVGKTLEEADAALSAHKARRQAEGARAARGEAPPGATIGAREEGRKDQTSGPAESDEVKEHAAEYSKGVLLSPAGRVEAGGRRQVAPGQGSLELYAPAENPVPATRAARAISATRLVQTGHFATGIERVRKWQDAAHIIAPLRKSPQESLLAVVTDRDGKVLSVIKHTTGTSTQSLVQQSVLVGAIARVPGASEVWFAHNHPSGDVDQSSPDNLMTHKLHELMRRSGINPRGMIVVGPGSTRATHYSTSQGQVFGHITPAARRGKVPIQERQYQLVRAAGEGTKLQTTSDAEQFVASLHDESGVVLLDSQLRAIGRISVPYEEMGKLRTGSVQSGTARILSEVEKANAVIAIVYGAREHASDMANIGQMLHSAAVNVADTIIREPSGHYTSNGAGLIRGVGQPFYRRGEASAGLSREHVQGVVHSAVREASMQNGFPHVEVHQDISTLPEHIRDLVEQQGAADTTGAVYDPQTGRIHLIADNNGTEQEVRENLWHEAVGHHGLRLAMDRPQYNAIMDGIARDMPERVEASARRNGLDLGDPEQKRAAAEEVVAYAAGQLLSGQSIDKPVLPFWTRAVRAVKAFFARMAGRPFYDDQAIAGLIQQAHQALEAGTAGSTPGEPMRSTRAPIYYSPVERAVTESKQGKASADQWLATIKKMPGVKPEELEWLNLEPWLREHKGAISREELADYVRANKLNIEETQYGAGAQTDQEKRQVHLAEELRAKGYEVKFDNYGSLESIGFPNKGLDEFIDRAVERHGADALLEEGHEVLREDWEEKLTSEEQAEFRSIRDSDGQAFHRFEMDDPDQADAARARLSGEERMILTELHNVSTSVSVRWAADDDGAGNSRGTRYGEYTLPGGQNYRELLLRLPVDEGNAIKQQLEEATDAFIDRLIDKGVADDYSGHATDVAEAALEGRLKPADRQKIEAAGLGADHAQLMQLAQRAESAKAEAPTYRSGHWTPPNIVAHTRFNERTDAEGRKVLHIEEIQSDWHQQGRGRGYRDPEKIASLEAQNVGAQAAYKRAADAVRRTRRADFGGTVEDVQRANHEKNQALQNQQAIERALIAAREAVPDAPFKTSWPMLVMKRMVRWAAEKGFDRIAWTTGKQQAERYNLAHHIDRIIYSRDEDGKYWVYADKNGSEVAGDINRQAMTKEQLAELVGQELADKMDRGEGTYAVGDGPHVKFPQRELSGLDLHVGGEGMKGFYDQILPRETNKLIKKYGGKVGAVELGTPNATVAARENRLLELNRQMRALGDPDNPYEEQTPEQEQLEREFNALQEEHQRGHAQFLGHVHGFDITPEMKQAALGEGFPMFARRQQDLPLEENRERGVYAAIRRAVSAVHGSTAVRDVRKLINPVGMSQESRQVASIARAALGELAHETVKTQEALENFSRLIDRIPIEHQLRMMDEIERGVPQSNPDFQPVADEMRKTLDTWRGKVQGLGEGYLDSFIQNYFPHYWRQPGEAERMVASIMGRRPLRGPASFLKMRTIPSIKEGMDAGLTPLTTNPLILTLLKTREMQRFVTGVSLMRRFKEDGLAKFLPAGRPMPEGWSPINDNMAKVRQWSEEEAGFIERGQYIMPMDAARVINNHVSASALRDFAPAQVFRRGANALNAMQLGFSAFHLGFTTLDAMISKNAQGIERLLHGEVGQAVRSFGEGLTPVGAFTNVRRGYKLLHAYSNPAGATPDMQKLVAALEQAGGRAHMDRYYQAAEGVSPFRGAGVRSLANDVRKALTAPQNRVEELGRALGQFPIEYGNKLWRGMQEIWKTTPAMEVPVEMAMRVVRASTSWIMEHLVPMQKLGVFSDLANDHLRRNPLEDPNARAASLQRIWDSVDNRLGEMVYDNVFWNRTLKDSLHLGIRAVGWNVGTIREIAGAPVDVVKAVDKAIRTGQVTADDLGHRIPYVLAMAGTTALYAAVYQYLATGQGPQETKDYFFPRTGGVTNYGTPARVSLPSYVKDVYEYSQRPGTTVTNKLNPIFSLMGNLYSNQDFFGNPITDPEAGYWRQRLQQLEFVGHELTPFSLQGRQQMQATEQPGGFGASVRKVLPMVGITPAPGYITSGEQMERRKRLEDDQKYTQELKYQIKKALLAKDKDKARELEQEYVQALKRMSETKKLVGLDRAKAAAARRKASISMRQAGFPATADLLASLPLEPDSAARQYFAQLGTS